MIFFFSWVDLWKYFFVWIQIDRSGKFPMLRFRDRESYAQNKTKEYDAIAMKYLTYVLLFLMVGFALYSLKYDKHKSWYSWILSSLTSCVYMFGKQLFQHSTSSTHKFTRLISNGTYICASKFFRFYHDVPTIIHQLQATVCRSYAMETDDLQVSQHYNRRSFRICY
jgi:hypothetical protein